MTQSPQVGNENASLTKLCVTCNQRFSSTATECPQDNGELFDLKTDPMFGRRVASGKYKVLRELGRGGMGAVYLTEDDSGKQVAVKLFKAQLTDRASATRFQEEAAAWSRLQHPHSATLLANLVDGKQPCLVVEFVHGKSLAVLMKQEGALPPERCLHIFSQVMDTIQYAHSNGVLHRDLKPGNIVLSNHNGDSDYVKVVDYMVENLSFGSPSNLGLADLVSRGPIYMSPEQCQGKKLTAASDTYSLGVALYECLLGKPPFKGRNSVETASMQISSLAPAFSVVNPAANLHSALEQVTLRALEKDPQKRFASMTEFKSALTQAVNDPESFVLPAIQASSVASAGSAANAEVEEPEQKLKVKKLPVYAIAIVAVALLCGIFAVAAVSTRKPTDTISFKGGGVGVAKNRVEEGTVFFVSLDPITSGSKITSYRLSELGLRTEKGELLKLTSNLPRDLKYPGPEVGDRCRAAVEGSSLAKIKVLESDTNIKLARDKVLQFVKDAGSAHWNAAASLFSKAAAAKFTAEALKKDWPGITLATAEYTFNDADRFNHEPLPQAIKILSAQPQKIDVLLNEDAVFDKLNAIDKFTLVSEDGGSWKIDAVEKRVPRKVWHDN